jgi:chromosome segregation ATPase
LLEISKVWKDMNDMDQAALLEILAGKTRSNTAAAILSNTKDLEESYVAALEAEGSALQENEKYLDSIQGKINQFTNAVQTMWSNTLDDSIIKQFVAIGTWLIKFIDNLGAIKALIIGIGAYAVNKYNLGDIFTSGEQNLEHMKKTLEVLKADMDTAERKDLQKRTSKSAKKKEDATKRYNDYASKVKAIEDEEHLNNLAKERLDLDKQLQDAQKDLEDLWAQGGSGDSDLGAEFDDASKKVDDLKKKIDENGMSIDEANEKMKALGDTTGQVSKKGVTGFKKFGQGVKSVGKAVGKLAAQMLAMYAITVALELVGKIFEGIDNAIDNAHESAEEAQEKFEQLRSELQDCTLELHNLESEFETIQDKIDELQSKGKLSFSDEEELQRLQAESDELKHQIDMQKVLQNNLQLQTNASSINATQKYLSDTSFDSEKTKSERQEEAKETGETIGQAVGLAAGAGIAAGGAALGAKVGGALGTFLGPLGTIAGVLAGAGIGALVGSLVGGAIGEASAGDSYDKEQRVEDAIDNMVNDRQVLQQKIDEAFANKDTEAYEQATEALQKYDAMMARHMSQIQANVNAIDYETATKEQRETIDQWNMLLDKYAITMGAPNAKENAINRILNMAQFEETSGYINAIQTKLENNEISAQDAKTYIQSLIGNNPELVNTLSALGISPESAINYLVQLGEVAAETKDKLSSVLTPLQNAETALKSLGDAFNTFEENGIITASTLAELQEQFGNLDGFEDFIGVLGDSSSTTAEVTQAVSKMASEYLIASGILSDITDENKAFVLSQLKALGVTNAEEYLRDIKSVQDAMAQQYRVDLSNYGTVEEMKAVIAGTLHDDIMGIQGDTLDELATNYGYDLSNFTSVEKAKTYIAAEEAKKRAGIERDAAGSDLDEIRDGTTVGKNDINGAFFGVDKYVGKTYAELKKMEAEGQFSGNSRGDKEAKEWLKKVEDDYQKQLSASKNAADETYNKTVSSIDNTYNQLSSLDDYIAKYNPTLSFDVDNLGGKDNPTTKAKTAWEKLVNKYENELALITNERDLIEAEIDKAEAKGGKASSEYYNDLISNSTDEKNLLIKKKQALEDYLTANADNVDQDTWTEMNNEINETAVAIKQCAINTLEYYDALEELDSHYFEQAIDDISRLGKEIEFVQGLLDGEKLVDENGNWTEAGITMQGLYVNEMERAAASAAKYNEQLDNVKGSWADYQTLLTNANDTNKDGIIDIEDIPTEKLDELYDKYGVVITSEEEFKEKSDELTDSIRAEYNAYDAAKDGLVEMHEARVDEIKNGIEKEIEAYEDYIGTIQDALDAERELWEFKNNINKQSKNIAALERRISALSGSTAAEDVAERRKLEAELVEAKEGINESFYENSRDAQSKALSDEVDAFNKSKEKYIEELEKTLDDTETLITNSIMDILLNADAVLAQLNDIANKYGFDLSTELITPWTQASEGAKQWRTELQEMLTGTGDYTALIGEGGVVTAFANGVASTMKGSWTSAQQATQSYVDFLTSKELGSNFEQTITGFGTQINNLVTYWGNVEEAAKKAHAEQERKVTVGGKDSNGDGEKQTDDVDYVSMDADSVSMDSGSVKDLQEVLNTVFGAGIKVDGKYGTATKAAVENAQGKIGATKDGYYGPTTRAAMEKYIKNTWLGQYGGSSIYGQAIKKMLGILPTSYYAKGTLGTSKNELAVVDEIGPELILRANPETGRLDYLTRGTSVMPADISANLVEWGKLNPNRMSLPNAMPNMNMISNAINKPELNFSVDNFLRCDNVSHDSLPELKQFVRTEMNNLIKQMNYAIKGKGGR